MICRLTTVLLLCACALSAQAIYPGAVATDTNLLVAANRKQTTLSSALNSSTCTILLASDVFLVNMAISIDSEIIVILTKTGSTVNTCTRGFDGTAAVSHLSGALVSAYLDAAHHNQVSAEIKAIETALGVNLANVPTVVYPIAVNKGGTNAITAAAARTNLSAAASGANSDITSLTAIATPLSVPQGGTGTASVTGALIGAGTAAIAGVAGTARQQLRVKPNQASVTYEFADPAAINSPDYNFPTQSPAGSIAAGSNTITLTPCPLGVNGSDTFHYFYLAGTGTPEAALMTGGTCTTGLSTGTVIVTAANTHAAGFTIQSATSGIREALIAGAAASKAVYTPSGTYNFYGPIYDDASPSVTWFGDGASSILSQQFTGDGIIIGPAAYGGNFTSIYNLRAINGLGGFAGSGALWTFRNLADGEVYGIGSYQGYIGFKFAGSIRVKYSGLFSNANNQAYTWVSTAVGNAGSFSNLYGTIQNGGIAALIQPTVQGLSITNFLFEASAGNTGTFGIYLQQDGTGGLNELQIGNGNVDNFSTNALSVPYFASGAEGTGATPIFHDIRFTNSSTSSQPVANINMPLFGLKMANCTVYNSGTGDGIVLSGLRRGTFTGNTIDVANAAARPLVIQQGAGAELDTDIEFSGNLLGFNGAATPTNAIATDSNAHAGLRFSANKINGGIGWAATGVKNWFDPSNQGLPINAIASAATLALGANPFPNFTVTGTTNVTAVSGCSSGQSGFFTPTGGTITFTSAASIGNSFIAQQNVPASYFCDAAKIWINGQTPALSNTYNYIGTEGGANNAITGTLTGVTLGAGLRVTVLLAHTLQAGANTFALNGGGAVAIKSSRNVANNIATAYAATGTITLAYDGTEWIDVSQ